MPAGGKVGAIKGESNLDFLERVALDAQVSSKKILEVAAKHKTNVQYDGTPISRNLNLVSRMIAGGMPTRVYYVSHGGFDTHTNQANTHDRLLGQLDSALKSFFTDLKQQGNDKRVVLMTFSEFGTAGFGKCERRDRSREGLVHVRRRWRGEGRALWEIPEPDGALAG